MSKQAPTGFIATCQCGIVIGAMDIARTSRKEAGQLLGKWLWEGCTVTPQFRNSWTTPVNVCRCDTITRIGGDDEYCPICDFGWENCTCGDSEALKQQGDGT